MAIVLFSRDRVRRGVTALVFVGLGFALAHALEYARFFYLMSKMLYERQIETAVARNHRGDALVATTDLHGAPDRPAETVVELKRRDRWFWTELFSVVSYGVRVGLLWASDNKAIVRLDFDCGAIHSAPVRNAGSIDIEYYFGDRRKLPANGYEVVPAQDVPQEPCRGQRAAADWLTVGGRAAR